MRHILFTVLTMLLAIDLQATSRVVTYYSTDQHGDKVLLSGKVSYPDWCIGDENVAPVIFGFHGTQFANKDIPSGNSKEDFKSLGTDKIYIMPDYLGYGVSSDRVHPYMYDELTARNCIDMLPVVFPLLDSLGVRYADSLDIVGFSQGAAVALWTLQILEKQYADKYPVRRAFLGGGSYDVYATYKTNLSRNKTDLPALIPYLIMGLSEAYDLNFQLEDFFSKKLVKNYDKWFLSKAYGLKELFFIMYDHRVDYWTTPLVKDTNDSRMQALTDAMNRCSIVNHPMDTIQAAVFLFHSTNDRVVPFVNAEHLMQKLPMTENIVTDFQAYGNHMKASTIFYKKVKEML